jgi:uncharacterized membrane protein YdcZ (DUF606 family)
LAGSFHEQFNKTPLFLLLSVPNFSIITVIDCLVGAEAVFLNAWVYPEAGALGELCCVLLANMLMGATLT